MKRLLPLLAALLLLLSGCVEYDEELWLNSDGSGRAKLRLIHHSPYSNFREVRRMMETPGIHERGSQVKQSGSDMIYEVDFDFDSIEAFNNLNEEFYAAYFWEQVSLGKTANGNIVFKRWIALGNQQGPPADSSYAGAEGDSSFVYDEDYINSLPDEFDILQGYMQQQAEQSGNSEWRYKLHVPWKIIHAGDNAENIDHANKTVSWKFDRQQMWNQQILMTVEMKKGISWIVYALIGLAGALVIFFIFWMIRINRRSHLHEAIKHRRERE